MGLYAQLPSQLEGVQLLEYEATEHDKQWSLIKHELEEWSGTKLSQMPAKTLALKARIMKILSESMAELDKELDTLEEEMKATAKHQVKRSVHKSRRRLRRAHSRDISSSNHAVLSNWGAWWH